MFRINGGIDYMMIFTFHILQLCVDAQGCVMRKSALQVFADRRFGFIWGFEYGIEGLRLGYG